MLIIGIQRTVFAVSAFPLSVDDYSPAFFFFPSFCRGIFRRRIELSRRKRSISPLMQTKKGRT